MRKVIVGLSGGVDSSVAALRLLEEGHQVEALFMKNWEEDDSADYCSAAEDLADAQAVCEHLDIPLHTVNFAAEYWDRVFEYFLAEYRAGRTPNPDVMCNKEIKFKAFLDYALDLGADAIATGHYARVEGSPGQRRMLKGRDDNKDQTYFLYTLGQAQLGPTLFPIGDLPKPDVRELARKAGLITHEKKDSTGICFIGERKFRDFLARFLPAQPGEIRTLDGAVIGQHAGLMYYTLGQRQGLGIGGVRGYPDAPWFVLGKDLQNNVLIAGQGHDHPALFHPGLTADRLHWVAGEAPPLPFHCKAKSRYRQNEEACTIERIDDGVARVRFARPHWAITPGQSVVFYDDELCLGGGTISAPIDF
ncbi:MAG: tRNA 2-thiouridine(34) synthase MnmA [Gammaproteobacteria bacterium]|nr:tRNA 2-thiouridine(34) synthase MnmA [Gammaproteobacteria bacterium]MCP5135647.1 tRNA 2-thiouridine(34) synthase MnmA [Gammaproteobacteria bacterium]